MEIEPAIKIVRALANGVHPESEAALDGGSVCRTPETVKALNRALAALVAQQEREKKRPKNAGKSWSQEEDAQICDELRQEIGFHQMANTHNRSVAAILARLVKLGKITPEKSGHSFPPKVA